MEEWLSIGKTILLTKNKKVGASNYRPITCLCTTFKLMTAIIADTIQNHLYKYNIIPEEQNIDRKTRKLMTAHRTLHPQSDIDRLYLPRKIGGRGLLQIRQTVEEEIRNLSEYINSSTECTQRSHH